MTQTVVVQVGQCGNQIGCQFWERALGEHAASSGGRYDSALASLFRNVDTRHAPPRELRVGDGRGAVGALRARAVLIDMEEGVVGGLRRGRLGELFEAQHCVTSVSGSGNNWAVGFYGYGRRYGDEVREAVRKAAELCDCLQSFLLLHSMGGGTGSGLGTHVLTMLRDDYPDVYRFVTAVYPSEVGRGVGRGPWQGRRRDGAMADGGTGPAAGQSPGRRRSPSHVLAASGMAKRKWAFRRQRGGAALTTATPSLSR